jgi:ABC-type glycerol-3-phosphate transport system substrate-binding protein
VAVSSRTEHPKAAVRFIWYLLSMQAQNQMTSGGIPVNLMSQSYWRSVFLDYKVKNHAPVDMDEAFVNRYFDSLVNLRSPVWWDADGNSLLTWCAIDMAMGQSFEEAYSPVREKLDEYFGVH